MLTPCFRKSGPWSKDWMLTCTSPPQAREVVPRKSLLVGIHAAVVLCSLPKMPMGTFPPEPFSCTANRTSKQKRGLKLWVRAGRQTAVDLQGSKCEQQSPRIDLFIQRPRACPRAEVKPEQTLWVLVSFVDDFWPASMGSPVACCSVAQTGLSFLFPSPFEGFAFLNGASVFALAEPRNQISCPAVCKSSQGWLDRRAHCMVCPFWPRHTV